jgi:hypothetical protein
MAKGADERSIETLNFVVVGMIAVFAAIMPVNTLVAATIQRRREFGRHRLVGSTPPQVLGMVSVEGAVLTAVGAHLRREPGSGRPGNPHPRGAGRRGLTHARPSTEKIHPGLPCNFPHA